MEEVGKSIAHQIGGVQNDALRFGLQGVKSDIVGSHPLQSAQESVNPFLSNLLCWGFSDSKFQISSMNLVGHSFNIVSLFPPFNWIPLIENIKKNCKFYHDQWSRSWCLYSQIVLELDSGPSYGLLINCFAFFFPCYFRQPGQVRWWGGNVWSICMELLFHWRWTLTDKYYLGIIPFLFFPSETQSSLFVINVLKISKWQWRWCMVSPWHLGLQCISSVSEPKIWVTCTD